MSLQARATPRQRLTESFISAQMSHLSANCGCMIRSVTQYHRLCPQDPGEACLFQSSTNDQSHWSANCGCLHSKQCQALPSKVAQSHRSANCGCAQSSCAHSSPARQPILFSLISTPPLGTSGSTWCNIQAHTGQGMTPRTIASAPTSRRRRVSCRPFQFSCRLFPAAFAASIICRCFSSTISWLSFATLQKCSAGLNMSPVSLKLRHMHVEQ